MLTIRPLMTAASSICCPPKQCRFRARHSNRPWLHNSSRRAPNPLSVGDTEGENAGTPGHAHHHTTLLALPSQPLTCAVQHVGSDAIKLLLEKFQVRPDNVHTRLNLHQRLRQDTQRPKNKKPEEISSGGGGSRNSSSPTRPRRMRWGRATHKTLANVFF